MSPEDEAFERERLESAQALARVTELARGEDKERGSESVLGPPVAATPRPPSPEADSLPDEWNPPAPPDLGPVNASFRTGEGSGSSSLLSKLGTGDKERQAQATFNADQVRLDNALVSWTAAHFAATHRHYDRVIERMQKRMDDIDTRHRELEREVVRHVHDMARRIDVVLGEGEKGRVSHEAALRSVRERLRAIEEKLGR